MLRCLQVVALCFIITLSNSQFVSMKEYIDTRLCNHSIACIHDYPEPIEGIMMDLAVKNSSTGVHKFLVYYREDVEIIPLICPDQHLPSPADIQICVRYLNGVQISACRNRMDPICKQKKSSTPPCCKWSDMKKNIN